MSPRFACSFIVILCASHYCNRNHFFIFLTKGLFPFNMFLIEFYKFRKKQRGILPRNTKCYKNCVCVIPLWVVRDTSLPVCVIHLWVVRDTSQNGKSAARSFMSRGNLRARSVPGLGEICIMSLLFCPVPCSNTYSGR